MSLLPVRIYGDPVLRKKSLPVERVDEEIRRLISDMAETMYRDKGVGLAAPQVGVSKRIVVVDVGVRLVALVNPEILTRAGRVKDEEGCLSLPGINLEINRAGKIKVKGINQNGEPVELELEGLLARAIQHEIDHLEGILIIDKINPFKKFALRKKLKELEKRAHSSIG